MVLTPILTKALETVKVFVRLAPVPRALWASRTREFDDYTLSGEVVDDAPVAGTTWDDERGSGVDVYYVRVLQAGATEQPRGMAWAGPVWVESG